MKKLLASWFLFVLSAAAFSQACYESSIVSPSPFMGNNDEIFKLADGTIWQVKYEYEYLYEYFPDVVICPTRGKLAIKGKTLTVQQIGGSPGGNPAQSAGGIESQIEGEFKGWDGETIFKLTNGQVWQQSTYAYMYSYKYRPKVLIFQAGGGFKLQVEGVQQTIGVRRLR